LRDTVISTTRDEHVAYCQRAQANGLTAQRDLSVSARADVSTFHHSNEFAEAEHILEELADVTAVGTRSRPLDGRRAGDPNAAGAIEWCVSSTICDPHRL
jgi:hypothetical protein